MLKIKRWKWGGSGRSQQISFWLLQYFRVVWEMLYRSWRGWAYAQGVARFHMVRTKSTVVFVSVIPVPYQRTAMILLYFFRDWIKCSALAYMIYHLYHLALLYVASLTRHTMAKTVHTRVIQTANVATRHFSFSLLSALCTTSFVREKRTGLRLVTVL